MSQGSTRYLQVLGLESGATRDEVKEAYRDLTKVWHPDRFSHDAKLQQKAQDKLKIINEAYEQLQSYEPSPPPSPRGPTVPSSRRGGPRVLHGWTLPSPSERLWVVAVVTVVLIVILLVVTAL